MTMTMIIIKKDHFSYFSPSLFRDMSLYFILPMSSSSSLLAKIIFWFHNDYDCLTLPLVRRMNT